MRLYDRPITRLVRLSGVVLAALQLVVSASAQPAPTEILSDPVAFTDVLDAFDGDDPFDIRISWGYQTGNETGTVQREAALDADDGRERRSYIDVAESERSFKVLTLDVEVGLFQDLMVFFQVPFVLEDQRRLLVPEAARDGGGLARDAIDAALTEPLPTVGEAPLFDLNNGVVSELRDGVPRVGLGAAWSPFNQYRTPGVPTWTLRLTTEVGTGAVMAPCMQGNDCSRGTSRGTIGAGLGSRWSYRYRVVEPYVGVDYVRQFVTSGESNFSPAGDRPGDVDATPPSEATIATGLAVIPWENRGRFQRLSVDALFSATHVSSGRDYGPLFDVLGTSASPYLKEPNREGAGGEAREVPFTGMTQVDEHARLGVKLALSIQAARYVRFRLGTGFSYATPHLLTGASPCNREVQAAEGDPRIGSCTEGIANPSYRAVIDQPGKRFRLDGLLRVDISAAASGQF